jgi:hypothetical protein
LDIVSDVKGIWLPLEKYLNGSLLLLWPDAIWAPRATTFVASFVLLIVLFILVNHLFESYPTAVLATTFVAFQPWYVWLSGTPMLEMYYLLCFFSGLTLLVIWLRRAYRQYWFWAGCCFALASGFHVQSWTFINIVNLFTVPHLVQSIRLGDLKRAARLVGLYAISNSLIAFFSIVEFTSTGEVFAFLGRHTTYSIHFYGGYDVSLWEKFVFYPQLILDNLHVAAGILFLIAIIVLVRNRAGRWLFWPLSIGVLALVLNNIMNILSVPPTAAPGRYSLFYLILLSPYVAYGAVQLFITGRGRSSQAYRYILRILPITLFCYSIAWGIVRLQNFPQGMSLEAILTGERLKRLINQNADRSFHHMIELKYWDFLGVQLAAENYDSISFDRAYDPINRNSPSLFVRGNDDVYAALKSQNIQYIALYNPDLIAKAQQMTFLQSHSQVGNWVIYQFVPSH